MYELWDLQSGNLIDTFLTEAEALAWVRRSLKDDGPGYAQGLAMLSLEAGGERLLTAQGGALVELALTRAPAA